LGHLGRVFSGFTLLIPRFTSLARLVASNLQSILRYTRQTMNQSPEFNPEKKFIRIIQTHATGLVEFEFAVGEPGLYVELLMAQSAFDEFCAMHGVTPTQGHLAEAQDSDTQEWDWSLHAARAQQVRHNSKA